jgi:hypothetical protein
MTVVQIIRNGWGSASMEQLVRQLVQHGVKFNTLVPSTHALPNEIIEFNKASRSFSCLSGTKQTYDSQDYTEYVSVQGMPSSPLLTAKQPFEWVVSSGGLLCSRLATDRREESQQ